jgi:hypothetical protein
MPLRVRDRQDTMLVQLLHICWQACCHQHSNKTKRAATKASQQRQMMVQTDAHAAGTAVLCGRSMRVVRNLCTTQQRHAADCYNCM